MQLQVVQRCDDLLGRSRDGIGTNLPPSFACRILAILEDGPTIVHDGELLSHKLAARILRLRTGGRFEDALQVLIT